MTSVACQQAPEKVTFTVESDVSHSDLELVVLGTIQDAGSPHIGCTKSCCSNLTLEEKSKRKVVSLGILNHVDSTYYLIDATPDMPAQIQMLRDEASWETAKAPDGVFLTHAHIGHYTGLMYFGREALGGNNAATYVMPKMFDFLSTNGPWSQLVALNNIQLKPIQSERKVILSEQLSIEPILVPHRDEFSETVGYKIYGPKKTILFIPDIDKWERWDENILEVIRDVDVAYLDASFYNTEELGHRDPREIPHPLIEESMSLFANLSASDKSKVRFIHLNHTNPALNTNSTEHASIINNGFNLAVFGEKITL